MIIRTFARNLPKSVKTSGTNGRINNKKLT